MWLSRIRAHISVTEWQSFLQWVLTTHLADFLDWEADVAGDAPGETALERQTAWFVERLQCRGWHCLFWVPAGQLFPRWQVIDPLGTAYEPGDTVFVNPAGVPETPGWPLPVSLLADLLLPEGLPSSRPVSPCPDMTGRPSPDTAPD